ncbi:MAG: ferritin-like domain-containing protein [Rhodospirillales bacterium]|nr:ferritin-like domain-containing protein [Rhodospirillales bacterium]
MHHWTLDDIDWKAFRPDRVDPEILRVAKAAALVEHNGADYAIYLNNVFAGDETIRPAIDAWALEEVQHGKALARWATLADPSWDFDAAFARFVDGYRIPLDASASVRGSRTAELIARCIVETGTSSYYAALADASEEPVFRQVCRHIAADELRHYKLFYDHMRRYQGAENLGRWGRLWTGIGRIAESEDDELSYAYYAANQWPAPYDRRTSARAYARRAYSVYRARHIDRGIGMALKAVGLRPQGGLHRTLAALATRLMTARARSLARAGA